MTYDWDEDWQPMVDEDDVDPMIMSAVGDRLWVDDAACNGADPNLFFLERGQPTGPAKKICYSCPVQDECLNYVMGIPGPNVGIWGSLSEKERNRVKRMREQGLET